MTGKKIIALSLIAILSVGFFVIPTAAIVDVNDTSVYVKQKANNTCTLVAMSMIFRRKAILDGNDNWQAITEASMKTQGNWNGGLINAAKYKDANLGLDMKASARRLYYMKDHDCKRNTNPKSIIETLKKELDAHPEGIVLYLYNSVSSNYTKWMHAVALTGYDKNGNFYCSDSGGGPKGIINLMDSILTDKYRANTDSLEELLSYSVKIWYVSSAANKRTSAVANPSAVPEKTEKECSHTAYDSYGKCKDCGKEYPMKVSSMTATVYEAVKKDVPVRNRPYSPDKIIKKLAKGDKVTVVASGKNAAGNLWYKTKESTWIYSKNLVKEQKTATNESKPQKTIADGTYVISTKLNSGCVLDVANGSKDNGANVQIWNKNDTAAQSFKITHVGNGYYRIANINSGKVLDAKDGSTKAGTNVWQYAQNDTDAQLWQIASAGNGYYNIICKKSGLYLDVNNGNGVSGENVQLWTGNGSDAQKWKFTKTSTSASAGNTEKKCTHTAYDGYGKCKSCGAEYPMKVTSMKETTYEAVKNDVPVRNRPYSPEKTIKKLSKGTKVTVVASGKNSAGNLWYKLKDGTWVYSGNLKK